MTARVRAALLAGALLLSALAVAPARAETGVNYEPTGYQLPGVPRGLVSGPDGHLWVTVDNCCGGSGVEVVRVDPQGVQAGFRSGLESATSISPIVVARDGDLWFGVGHSNSAWSLERLSPATGQITTYALPDGGTSSPAGPLVVNELAEGPDGSIWIAGGGFFVGQIARLDPSTRAVDTFQTANAERVQAITAGPDGNIWFGTAAQYGGGHGGVGYVTPAGQVVELPTRPTDDVLSITTGPDHNLWFTERQSRSEFPSDEFYGTATTSGALTEFKLSPGWLHAITTSPDGGLWFGRGNAIESVATSGHPIELIGTGLGGNAITAVLTLGPDRNLWLIARSVLLASSEPGYLVKETPAGGSDGGDQVQGGGQLPGACANEQRGTNRSGALVGTSAGDRLLGLGGNDRLSGLGGDDCLSGGPGNDTLSGGSGSDRLTGGTGKDRLSGGSGSDRLSGGPGNDTLTGGGGRNRYAAGQGDDTVNARNHRRDRVDCGPGRDSARVDRFDRVRGCEQVTRR